MYDNIICIPFRNRDEHLKHFINNTVPLIQKHLPNTLVLVIEQNDGKLFNRGALLNVGFKQYKNQTRYFFTHDVDISPTLDIVKTVYARKDIEAYRIFSAHNLSLGGIIKIEHDKLFDTNGFPNYIWGWGIEDRALFFRCLMKKVTITENKEGRKLFNKLPHKSNGEMYKGEKKKISDKWTHEHINKLNLQQKNKMIMESGINNVKYTVLERKMIHDIVEIIKVDI